MSSRQRLQQETWDYSGQACASRKSQGTPVVLSAVAFLSSTVCYESCWTSHLSAVPLRHSQCWAMYLIYLLQFPPSLTQKNLPGWEQPAASAHSTKALQENLPKRSSITLHFLNVAQYVSKILQNWNLKVGLEMKDRSRRAMQMLINDIRISNSQPSCCLLEENVSGIVGLCTGITFMALLFLQKLGCRIWLCCGHVFDAQIATLRNSWLSWLSWPLIFTCPGSFEDSFGPLVDNFLVFG